MKILHVISSLSLEGGGPAQGVRNLTSYYSELGAIPTVLTLDNLDTKLGNTEHLEVIRLGQGNGVFSYHPKLVSWLTENAHKFDAVIVHGLWQYHGYADKTQLAIMQKNAFETYMDITMPPLAERFEKIIQKVIKK